MMTQKQKNADAVNTYISTKKVVGGNDLVRIIKADVSYTNHKTEIVTILSDVEITRSNVPMNSSSSMERIHQVIKAILL